MKPDTSKSHVQGEGDYESARKYDKQAHEFAASGKAGQAAKAAAPRNAQEQEEMRRAEAEGRSHAKGGGQRERGSQGKPSQGGANQHPEGYNPAPKKVPGR